jgi:TRAP-type C4-dicarboxylate transport system permease small subunit
MNKKISVVINDSLGRLNRWCATIAGVILLFVTLSIFMDVILRYFFDRPSIWITEVSSYLFLYIIFLGTAYALQQGSHIRVTFLQSTLSGQVQPMVDLITAILSAFFTAVLLWQSCVMTWSAYTEKWTSPTMLNAPYAAIHVVMVIGSFLLLITFGSRILMLIQDITGQSEDHP